MKFLMTFVASLILSSVPAWAVDSDVEELNLIEMELDKSSPPAAAEDAEAPEASSTESRVTLPPGENQAQDVKKNEITSFEDLGRLADFRQVSVIQKRYLPRTGRFQAFIGPSMVLNDPWFNVYGGTVRLGYNFLEAWGIEAGYSFMSTNKTQALRELWKNNDVSTDNFVYTKSYYNVDLNWTPFYGKMTWFDQKIIYYDTYFSFGYGGTTIQTNDVQSTLHLGAGQIFSMSKRTAFRWDISWNFFEAKQIDSSQGTYNNVFISAGMSFFFPEATYR